jgi:hypothetical protein
MELVIFFPDCRGKVPAAIIELNCQFEVSRDEQELAASRNGNTKRNLATLNRVLNRLLGLP